MTVTASYPLAGICVKQPDGVMVEVDGSVGRVSVWMRGPASLGANEACTSECGFVTQTVMLDEPLPKEVTSFEPATGAAEGCA